MHYSLRLSVEYDKLYCLAPMKDGIFYNRGILDGHYYGTLLPSAASLTATTMTPATNTQKPSPFKRSATLIVCETTLRITFINPQKQKYFMKWYHSWI